MKKLPILIVACHASTFVPDDIRAKMLLTDEEITRQSDLYTDEIFEVPNCHFINGTVSRLTTDLNRSPEHIELEQESEFSHTGVVVSVSEEHKKM